MRLAILLLGLGLAVWAQSAGPETRSALHYDATRHALILTSSEQITLTERIEVVDLIGRRVLTLSPPSGENGTLTLPVLPEGLYYARWISENGRIRAVRRFAVQH